MDGKKRRAPKGEYKDNVDGQSGTENRFLERSQTLKCLSLILLCTVERLRFRF